MKRMPEVNPTPTSDAMHPQSAAPARLPPISVGAAGLIAAGTLQLLAGLPVMLPHQGSEPVSWQFVCWVVGGALLLLASGLLATGGASAAGIAGSSQIGLVALIAFGADGLLSLGVGRLALAVGADATTAMTIGFGVVRFLGATTVTTVVLAREGTLIGRARWTFALIVVSDAISVVLLLALPDVTAFLISAYIARPALLVVVGAAVLAGARANSAR